MKRTRIAAWAAAAALVVAGVIAPPAATASTPELTDEQLVLGLVFGVGEFADEIGTTADVRPSAGEDAAQAAAAYELSAREVTDDLLAGSDELAQALDQVRAGDPALTEQAFATIGDVLDGYAAEQVAESEAVAADPDRMQALSPCGVAVVCWAYAAAAVHNTVVVTGAAAVVVAAALWCGAWAWCGNSVAPTTEKSQLMREQFAVDVTRAAAVQS
jgi:SdpC family antimicrobial peptide